MAPDKAVIGDFRIPLDEISIPDGLDSFGSFFAQQGLAEVAAGLLLMMQETDGPAGEPKGTYRVFSLDELQQFCAQYGLPPSWDRTIYESAWRFMLAVQHVIRLDGGDTFAICVSLVMFCAKHSPAHPADLPAG